MSNPSGNTFLPPRPIHGPERLVESRPITSLHFAVVLTGLTILLLVAKRLRTRKNAQAGCDSSRDGSDVDGLVSPRDRLVALSHSIRTSLSLRFGVAYLAKTSEELANDRQLSKALCPADLQRFIEILELIDSVKFSADEHSHAVTSDQVDWLAAIKTSFFQSEPQKSRM